MDLVTCMSKNSVITMQEINTVEDALQAPMAHFEDLLVTLAGYCVHSTVVPAIVPIFFSRQLSKSTRRENFLPMVGGALERGGKEGQDRLLIRNQPTIFFRKKTNSLDQPL